MGSTYFTWGVLGWLYSGTEKTVYATAVYAPDAPYNWAGECRILFYIFIPYFLLQAIVLLTTAKSGEVRKRVPLALFCFAMFILCLVGLSLCIDADREWLLTYRTWK